MLNMLDTPLPPTDLMAQLKWHQKQLQAGTYVHVCMYVHVRTYVCTYVCMHVCTYVRTYVCIYVCTSVCI